MNEARLIEKLRAIEALYAGATTPGEKVAAGNARDRIRERLLATEREDPAVEYRFTMADMWRRRVFIALLRRYGIHPYRYKRQRHTTVMASVSKRFVDDTLWPEFRQISKTLEAYLSEVTGRVVSQVIHDDASEAAVVDDPKQLPVSVSEPVAQPGPAPEATPVPPAATDTPANAAPSADPPREEKTKSPGRSKQRGRKKKKRKRNKGRL